MLGSVLNVKRWFLMNDEFYTGCEVGLIIIDVLVVALLFSILSVAVAIIIFFFWIIFVPWQFSLIANARKWEYWHKHGRRDYE